MNTPTNPMTPATPVADATTGQAPEHAKHAAETWAARYAGAVMNTFGTPQLTLTGGHGCTLVDDEGKEYLDLLGGIAVNVLGQAHPAVVAAVTEQIHTLGHVSNYFATPPHIQLAERLLSIISTDETPEESRVFLANSGAEANECALKIVKAYGVSTGRTRILVLDHAFHGRTLGALSLTWKEAYRQPFAPLIPGIEFIPANDSDALRTAMNEDVAGFFVEPIQGEAGVHVLDDDYLRLARELTREHGALLVVDEVQCGIGRTGAWMGHHHSAITPDVVTLAKGLGGGLPIGACVAFGETASILGPGMHGTTFGGNPVCAAAAVAVLDTIESEGLIEHARDLGHWLRCALREAAPHMISEVRGRGLLIGIELTHDIAPQIVACARDAGFIVNATSAKVLRLAPPLILSQDEAASFVDAFPSMISRAQEMVSAERKDSK
ncbi:acetylornithine transaminase [Schaalia sp. ZJ1691]|uniref:acetylornithine transaminase n=1 Tax=Schaalia sp. ZJ1691 TaxID=2709404 RepID=UPI001F151F70|nr:acetylornithine transaminase [Schaalia sp. ZJ1691]